MGSDIKRPAYTAHEASDVAQAASLIAAEARAADRTVLRPFGGSTLEGRPTWTAAHSVMWWHVDQERARDRAHDAERDALHTRAEAAEQRAEGWRWFAQEVASDMHPIGADPLGDITTDLLPVLLDITRRAAQQQGADCARAEAAEKRAEAAERELAQARADRALLAGLWLGTVAPRVLPAILPTDQGDRERLVAALDAVDLQPSAEACIAAGRAVIARIVAETGGGAA